MNANEKLQGVNFQMNMRSLEIVEEALKEWRKKSDWNEDISILLHFL